MVVGLVWRGIEFHKIATPSTHATTRAVSALVKLVNTRAALILSGAARVGCGRHAVLDPLGWDAADILQGSSCAPTAMRPVWGVHCGDPTRIAGASAFERRIKTAWNALVDPQLIAKLSGN